MKNYSIFAASIPQTVFLTFVCVAFFIATYSAVNAANIGYQFPVDCCTSKSVIVCGRTGGDSLSYIDTLIFHSQMPQTMKNVSKSKHSTLTLPSTGTKSELQKVESADAQVFKLPDSLAELQPLLMMLKDCNIPVLINFNITNNNMTLGDSKASNINLVTSDNVVSVSGHNNQSKNGDPECPNLRNC
jgi:hypothetical protein